MNQTNIAPHDLRRRLFGTAIASAQLTRCVSPHLSALPRGRSNRNVECLLAMGLALNGRSLIRALTGETTAPWTTLRDRTCPASDISPTSQPQKSRRPS